MTKRNRQNENVESSPPAKAIPLIVAICCVGLVFNAMVLTVAIALGREIPTPIFVSACMAAVAAIMVTSGGAAALTALIVHMAEMAIAHRGSSRIAENRAR